MNTTPIPTFPLRGKEIEGKASMGEKNPLPLRGRCAETWSRGPDFGDATVEAHISTRVVAALHPTAGSHPSAKADGTCSALRGRGVRGNKSRVISHAYQEKIRLTPLETRSLPIP